MHEGAKATLRPADRWLVTDLLETSFTPLVCLYVYLLILLPSGSIGGVNLKISCFALLLLPTLYHLVRQKTISGRHLGVLIALPTTLACWIFIAQLYRYDLQSTFYQFKDIVITLISAWMASVYFQRSDRARIRFLRWVLHAAVTLCALKVMLLTYCVFRGIPVSIVVKAISRFMGVSLMETDFESSLGRVQFVADEIIPICIYVLVVARQRLQVPTRAALMMLAFLFVSLTFTFSRYSWGAGVAALLLGLFSAKWERFHDVLIGVLVSLLLISSPFLIALVQLRFSTDLAAGSDITRVIQIVALKKFFWDAPLFGHGFGSFTHDVVRSSEAAYNYEVQLLALAGQAGIVGLLLLCLIAIYYFRSLWRSGGLRMVLGPRQRICVFLLLLIYLAGGLFNPSLFNSAAAMSYAAIKAFTDQQEEDPQA